MLLRKQIRRLGGLLSKTLCITFSVQQWQGGSFLGTLLFAKFYLEDILGAMPIVCVRLLLDHHASYQLTLSACNRSFLSPTVRDIWWECENQNIILYLDIQALFLSQKFTFQQFSPLLMMDFFRSRRLEVCSFMYIRIPSAKRWAVPTTSHLFSWQHAQCHVLSVTNLRLLPWTLSYQHTRLSFQVTWNMFLQCGIFL